LNHILIIPRKKTVYGRAAPNDWNMLQKSLK